MLENVSKQLWVISENSISKFNPEQGTFENYGNNYFQRELNLTEAVPALTGQNRIVLGTNQGILEINTEQMKKSSYVPPIVFTGLKIQGSQLHVALDDIQELELEPSERNVTFQFAAIDYVNPDDGRRYIDEETDWDYSPLEGKGTADHEPCTTISTFMAVYGHQKLS